MKKMSFVLLSAMLLSPAVGVCQAPAGTATNEEQAIRELFAAYDQAWKRRDAEAVAGMRTEDAEVVNRFGLWSRPANRAENARSLAQLMATIYKEHEPPVHTVELVRFIRPDVAIVHTSSEQRDVVLPDGTKIPPFQEVNTYVLVKEEGRWLITSENIQNVGEPPIPKARE